MRWLPVNRITLPPARQRPERMCLATSANSSGEGWESASMNSNQSPWAAAAPELRARPIWLTGSKTTVAPAARAMAGVWSVELLSQTISSESQFAVVNAERAWLMAARVWASKRASLKAGTTTEIFIGVKLVEERGGVQCRFGKSAS